MFSVPRVNVISSDTGFTVEVLGQTGLLYSEDGRCVLIDSELLSGPHGLVLSASSIRRWEAGDAATAIKRERTQVGPEVLVDGYMSSTVQRIDGGGPEISDEERNRIVENIRSAFRFRGFEIEVT
jgi:hypothetical protein